MMTTLTMSPTVITKEKVRRAARPASPKPAELREQIRTLNQLTDAIELHWDEAPAELRNLMRDTVYVMIRPGNPLHNLRGRMLLALNVLVSGPDLVAELMIAIQRFTNTVLELTERRHPSYEKDKADALKTALDASRRSRSMSSGEFREWLGTIENQAMRDIQSKRR